MHIMFNTYPVAAYMMTRTHILFHWSQLSNSYQLTQVLWWPLINVTYPKLKSTQIYATSFLKAEGKKKCHIPTWHMELADPNPAVLFTQNGRQPSNTITTLKLKSDESDPLHFRWIFFFPCNQNVWTEKVMFENVNVTCWGFNKEF